MTIDMQYFDVYYFCHLANESMGKFEYIRTNAEFTERQFEIPPQEFPKISVLRGYCFWLVDRVLCEQADSLSNLGEVVDFDPICWMNQAIFKYKRIDISTKHIFDDYCDDYLEKYNQYIEALDSVSEGLFYEVVESIAVEMEYILFQNRDFLLRFNEQQASFFETNPRKRTYIPEWVKRAVLFRDKGCCVFCKKDLTGLYTLLEDNEKHFDHIVPLSEGGLNDVCNIQLSCQKCNLTKSDTSRTSTLYQSTY